MNRFDWTSLQLEDDEYLSEDEKMGPILVQSKEGCRKISSIKAPWKSDFIQCKVQNGFAPEPHWGRLKCPSYPQADFCITCFAQGALLPLLFPKLK